MARYFDIMPPRPKPKPAAPTRSRKSGWGFLFFIILVLGCIAIFSQIPMDGFELKKTNKTAPVKTEKKDFQLFDETGQSTLTQEKTKKIRLLNASGSDERFQKAKTLLEKAEFSIEQSGNSTNLYDKTNIYYKKEDQLTGQKAEEILKTDFQTVLQESENLGSSYDILIIVGKN